MKAFYPDDLYLAAGENSIRPQRPPERCKGGTLVQPPTIAEIDQLDKGTIVIGFMNATNNLEMVARMRDRKITAFALGRFPDHPCPEYGCSHSQTTAAGYTAAILGANNCPKFLPMLTTAAGTIRPAHRPYFRSRRSRSYGNCYGKASRCHCRSL